jgi:hypothetical protein
VGEALDRISRALASGTSRRTALGGLLAGSAVILPWTAEAKKKKHRHKKKFKKFQESCNQWCGDKFGSSGQSFTSCVNKAKEGKGPCYSSTEQGPGFFCTQVKKCGDLNCCPDLSGGDPVTDGLCCTTDCEALNGTLFCPD